MLLTSMWNVFFHLHVSLFCNQQKVNNFEILGPGGKEPILLLNDVIDINVRDWHENEGT